MIPVVAHINNLQLDQASFFLYTLTTYSDIDLVIATDNAVNDFMRDKFVFVNRTDVYKIRNAIILTFPDSCDDSFFSYMNSKKVLYVNTMQSQYAAFKEKRYVFDNTLANEGLDYIIKPTDKGIYSDIPATHVIDEFDYEGWKNFCLEVERGYEKQSRSRKNYCKTL